MKKLIVSLLIGAAIGIAVCSEPALAHSHESLVATVPFQFHVNDRVLPAGEYIISQVELAGNDGLRIQSKDGRLTVYVLSRVAAVDRHRTAPQLVFHRYAESDFLALVVDIEDDTAQQLPRSSAEQEAIRGSRDGAPQRVAVTAKSR